MSEAPQAQALPAEALVPQLLLSQLVSRLMYVTAKLKLADQLTNGARTAEELAPLTGTNAAALYRVMRTLSSLGFLTEDTEQRFSLLPLGALLQSGTPGHAAALIMGGEFVAASLDNLLYSVQTGRTGFEKAFGMPLFEYLAAHAAEASLFNQTMVGFHGMEPPAVAAAYDFSQFETIADVGGSTGNLLATILEKHPRPRGILFDLPHVMEGARAVIAKRGLTDRIHVEAGSFFESVPPGADAYILSHVIHDCNPEQCLQILGCCRRAAGPNSRLLLVEMVLPEGDAPHPGKMLDIIMLAAPGGEERTASQYSSLLERAGFRMTQVAPTASPVSVVEAVPR